MILLSSTLAGTVRATVLYMESWSSRAQQSASKRAAMAAAINQRLQRSPYEVNSQRKSSNLVETDCIRDKTIFAISIYQRLLRRPC